MNDLPALLKLAREAVLDGLDLLTELDAQSCLQYEHPVDLPKELKTNIDMEVEAFLLEKFNITGFPVLAEETGEIGGDAISEFKWVIDPLDGTANFTRKLGQCAISVALMKESIPVFGVIGTYPDKALAWGGKEIGSYLNDVPIQVSDKSSITNSVLCTGFPARFEFNNEIQMKDLFGIYNQFLKIRMLGSAAISLLQVAKGSADAYMEKNIMLWDVAAGLAIVEGAGGCFELTTISKDTEKHCLNVKAGNGKYDL